MDLKDHPIPDGVTNYCSGRFSTSRCFGKKRRSKSIKKQLNELNKKLKKLSKKIKNCRSFKKNNKKHKRRRSFGNNMGPINPSSSLGLPDGVKGASNIYQTFPNIYRQGAALSQPYDPVDNLRMQSRWSINGFGTTPGTPEWKESSIFSKSASDNIKLYDPIVTGQKPNLIGDINWPAAPSNNQDNIPGRGRSFGPNNVGYEPKIPIYHGGANTINFETNKMFNTNMIGDVQMVQRTSNTPTAWLANKKGFGRGFGKESDRGFGKKGFGKKGFGDLVYTNNGPTSGLNVMMQPSPIETSNKFGETTITLQSDGRIEMS